MTQQQNFVCPDCGAQRNFDTLACANCGSTKRALEKVVQQQFVQQPFQPTAQPQKQYKCRHCGADWTADEAVCPNCGVAYSYRVVGQGKQPKRFGSQWGNPANLILQEHLPAPKREDYVRGSRRICINCGNEFPAGDHTCINCGQDQRKAPQGGQWFDLATLPAMQQPAGQKQPTQQPSTWKGEQWEFAELYDDSLRNHPACSLCVYGVSGSIDWIEIKRDKQKGDRETYHAVRRVISELVRNGWEIVAVTKDEFGGFNRTLYFKRRVR